jgi:hypothetical protein
MTNTSCWCGLGDYTDPSHEHKCLRQPGPKEGDVVTDLATARAPACWKTGSRIKVWDSGDTAGRWCFCASTDTWTEANGRYATRAEAYAAAVQALEAHSRETGEI